MNNPFVGMDAEQACSTAIADIRKLILESETDWHARYLQVKVICDNLALAQQDDALNELLIRAFRVNGALYELASDAIEEHAGRKVVRAAGSAEAIGELYLCPVVIQHESDIADHANWIDLLPRVGSGGKLRGLSRVLFTYDDLSQGDESIRDLHSILFEHHDQIDGPVFLNVIPKWRSKNVNPGPFDRFLTDSKNNSVSLRFLVAYRTQDEDPWFASEDEVREWALRVSHVLLPLGIDLKPPRLFARGLYVGEGMVKHLILNDLLREAIESSASNRFRILVEDFGHQKSATSLFQRVSIYKDLDGPWVVRHVFRRYLPSDRTRWKHSFEQLRMGFPQIQEADWILSPLVQPIEALPRQPPPRTLQILLGPTVAFERAAPDGLPIDSDEEGHELKLWWSYERDAQKDNGELVVQLVCTALGVSTDEVSCECAFILNKAKWYSAIVLGFDAKMRTDGNPLDWPPDKKAIDAASSMIGLIGGRGWVSVQVVGD
jgi:hypothetical protein